MEAFETSRLAIRNFRGEDWRDLHEMSVRYQATEFAQYDVPWPTAADEIRGVAEWLSGEDGYLAVCLRGSGKLIGLIATPQEEGEGGAFGFGYVFHPAYHGAGYATEACRAVLDYAFSERGAKRVHTETAEANTPSCRLLRRLGFQKVGRGSGSFRETEDGEPIAFVTLSFALTKEAWAARM